MFHRRNYRAHRRRHRRRHCHFHCACTTSRNTNAKHEYGIQGVVRNLRFTFPRHDATEYSRFSCRKETHAFPHHLRCYNCGDAASTSRRISSNLNCAARDVKLTSKRKIIKIFHCKCKYRDAVLLYSITSFYYRLRIRLLTEFPENGSFHVRSNVWMFR